MKKYYASFDDDKWRETEELSDSEWAMVPKVLDSLGVKFAPIYGAEPFTRFNALLLFISNATKIGLPTSVITNGVYLNKITVKRLKMAGLDSITLSCDIEGFVDVHSKLKSQLVEKRLNLCLKEFRDVEVVVTVTPKNIKLLPEFVKLMTEKGVWTHFDIIHPDRRQPGSKCMTVDESYYFKPQHKKVFLKAIRELIRLKRDEDALIHVTEDVMRLMEREYERYIICYGWKCKGPSWITVDSTGYVYGCDDFQPENFKFHILDNWEWDRFAEEWIKQLRYCPGCFWTTHVMSDLWWGKTGWEEYIAHKI